MRHLRFYLSCPSSFRFILTPCFMRYFRYFCHYASSVPSSSFSVQKIPFWGTLLAQHGQGAFSTGASCLPHLGTIPAIFFLQIPEGCDMSKSRLISVLNIYFLPFSEGENSLKSYQVIILPSLIHPLGFYLVLLHSVI